MTRGEDEGYKCTENNEDNSVCWWSADVCVYCIGSREAVFQESTVCNVCDHCGDYTVCSCVVEGWDRSLCSRLPSLCPAAFLPHRHTQQQTPCTSVYPRQSGVFRQHRATHFGIYISIHGGLTVFNSTSLRQSFTGCAIHDRLCTECELWIMQNIQRLQGYS